MELLVVLAIVGLALYTVAQPTDKDKDKQQEEAAAAARLGAVLGVIETATELAAGMTEAALTRGEEAWRAAFPDFKDILHMLTAAEGRTWAGWAEWAEANPEAVRTYKGFGIFVRSKVSKYSPPGTIADWPAIAGTGIPDFERRVAEYELYGLEDFGPAGLAWLEDQGITRGLAEVPPATEAPAAAALPGWLAGMFERAG